MVSWNECPHLLTPRKKAQRVRIIKMYGENSTFVQSMVYGRFQRAGTVNTVFSNMDIDTIKLAMKGVGSPIEGPRRASIDFSGGGDSQVLMLAEGTDIKEIRTFNEKDEIKLARKMVGSLRDLGIDPTDCFGDAGGLGATVIKYMQTDLGYNGVRQYLNNRKPRNDKRFADRMTEDHWKLKMILTKKMLKVPYSEDLLTQMRKRLYEEKDYEKLKLEPKPKMRARNEPSPDHLDALVMIISDVNIEWPDFKTEAEKEKTHKPTEWEEAEEESVSGSQMFGPIMKDIHKGRFNLPSGGDDAGKHKFRGKIFGR